MRRFATGLLTGVLLAPLAAGLTIAAVLWWRDRPPGVQAGTILELKLTGGIAEHHLFDLWRALRKAQSDPKVTALYLQPDSVAAGWAKLSELREAILRFRQTGRQVTAFLRTPTARDYYLASAANRIVVAPSDFVDLKGLRVELLYARGLLDKMGILPEFEAAGKYKDGADTWTRQSMTEPTREVINELLDARFAHLIDTIAAARSQTAPRVRAMIDRGPFPASDARREGLIDAVEYEDQALRGTTRIDAHEYARTVSESGPTIAVLVAAGDILRGNATWLSEEALDPESFIPVVRQIRDDSRIRAVLLRVDSPGGDAIASNEMLRELRLLAAKKPMVVSMSDIAASGGYSLSLASSPIVAYPATLTGSIGVFYGKLVFAGLYQKLGMKQEVMTRGRFADIDSESRALSDEGRTKFRAMLDQMYRDFVSDVAAARKIPYAAADGVAQGRVWLGSQARERGLVDELGGIETALRLTKAKVGLKQNDPIKLALYPRGGRWREIDEWLARLKRLRGQSLTPRPALWMRAPAAVESLR